MCKVYPWFRLFSVIAFVAISLLLACKFPAQAQNKLRVALVIGNNDYQHANPLNNPRNDSELIASILKRHGVDTIVSNDLTLQSFKKVISEFLQRLARLGSKAEGILFYAGHGIQFDGRNFLIPVDADLKTRSDIPLYSVELDTIINSMRALGNKSNIIILDACRNNPFRGMFRGSDGLAAEGAPAGFLISFSTSPRAVAADGDTGNSPFAAALAKFIQTPGMPIETVLKRVRYSVWQETNGAQIPWENTSLFHDFSLVPGNAAKLAHALPLVRPSWGAKAAEPIKVRYGADGLVRRMVPGNGSNENFRDCADCPALVIIPSGGFTMGSTISEQSTPPHDVRFGKPFAVSRSEISFDELLKCKQCNIDVNDEGWGTKGMPAINVTWQQANAYVKWLSQKTGYRYRLLSEAEWEYVAQADTAKRSLKRLAINPSQANIDFGDKRSRMQTMPIDTLRPNAWGVFHIFGNVAEWTLDCWHKNYSSKPTSIRFSGKAWVEDGCYSRVIRGGGWASEVENVGVWPRQWRRTNDAGPDIGFRVMRELN